MLYRDLQDNGITIAGNVDQVETVECCEKLSHQFEEAGLSAIDARIRHVFGFQTEKIIRNKGHCAFVIAVGQACEELL